MKKILIAAGVLAVVGTVVGYCVYKKQNKIQGKDFDVIVSLSKNKGYDIFDGLSATQLESVRKKYLEGFNIKTHNQFMSLLQKGEKSWNTSDKNVFNDLIKKIK